MVYEWVFINFFGPKNQTRPQRFNYTYTIIHIARIWLKCSTEMSLMLIALWERRLIRKDKFTEMNNRI